FGFFRVGSFRHCLCRHFPETVCVHFWTCLLCQENTSDVCGACGLIRLVDVHLVNEKLDISVKLQRIRFMNDRYIPTVPTALTAVVLIPRNRYCRNVECFCTQPVNVRCL